MEETMTAMTLQLGTRTAPRRAGAPRRAPAPPVAPAVAPVRLTRRGRLLLTLLTLVLAVGAAVLATGSGSAVAGLVGGPQPAATQQVTVRPGETLWAIAERTAPGVDPRETVAELMDLNALSTSAVQAGQVLLLPPR